MNQVVSNQGRSPRTGKTLIELAIVVGVVGTVLTFVGQVMVGLFRVEGRTRSTVVAGSNVDRLAAHFREDVRGARTVEVSPAEGDLGPRCTLTPIRGVASKIVYAARDGAVTRTVERTGNVDFVGDTFGLGDGRATFAITDDRFVVLGVTVDSTGDSAGTPRFATRVEVRLPDDESPAPEPTP